ncbi:MAG TPA: exonuclease SbcCD subunit D [Candidatus Syntrophoarchaeum butanivorans]|uniref:Exonuclease SbcCD subunit D n=1 Tax=Candidatus Syntropharchaeum butanivorans TaxID=1839936 RepID=A0A7C1B7Q2_9EURY|nr:exonuclease SbcCD subunit D [Candidatus Syntrophoarchaeum butanivorans]
MRVLHVADTHIGYSAYRRVDSRLGLNQREVDVYNAFTEFVNYAIETHPDLILHAGDLFDSVRPTNRAISHVLELLLRLSGEGIPFVVISGNHETPRLRETGSVFKLFEHLDGIYPVYEGRYDQIVLDDLGVIVHAIPHTQTGIKNELEKVDKNESFDYNILMLHAGISGVSVFKQGVFNEEIIDYNELMRDFDYIALGHYHRAVHVGGSAYYSGSTERFSFAEAGEPKGFLEVDLGGDDVVRFRKLNTRDMIDLEPLDCTGLRAEEIMEEIRSRIVASDPAGKIVRLKVEKIPLAVYNTIEFDEIKRLTADAVHFEIRWDVLREEGGTYSTSVSFRSIKREFERYMVKLDLEEGEMKRLLDMGLRYLGEQEKNGEGGET